MADIDPAEVDRSRVKITLNGNVMTLVPTPRVMLALSQAYKGYVALNKALHELDLQAYIDVVTAASGLGPGPKAKQLQDDVCMAGMFDLRAPLIEFVNILANGGRALPLDPVEEPEGEGEKKS